jgi:RNA polymerase sigma-70 factor, ECF subfamily
MRVMHVVEAQADPDRDRSLATSYLYRVAHSALVDEIRRVRRRREEDLNDEEVDARPATRQSPDPERLAASHEVGRGIQECLSRMNPDRRLAVTLYLQGHTVPEAARILDWSGKRTENLVYRGLADLRECLMAKGMRP